MTTARAPFADRLPPVTRAQATVSLATLSIDLSVVARFPSALLQRRSFLPFGWKDGALQVVVPPRFDRAVADEVAFAAGCPLLLVEAGDGNLPKLIQTAVESMARGEHLLPPKSADNAGLSSELVYLEDFSSLGAAASPSLGASPTGPTLLGDGGISLGQALSSAMGHEPAPAAMLPRAADLLPPVVDLEPATRADPPPSPRAPSPPPHPPGSTRRAGREEELFEDPDAPDLDLMALPDLDGEGESRHHAILVGSTSDEAERLGQALRDFDLRVTKAPLDEAPLGKAGSDDPALMVFSVDDPVGDPLSALRRLRKDEARSPTPLVAVLLVPRELVGWRIEADLQATYGADLVLGPDFEVPLLRRRLAAAFRARTGGELPLRPGPGEAKALDLSRRAAESYLGSRLEEAISLFEAALHSDPSLASAQVGLAMAMIKQQRPVEAILAFERALSLDPLLSSALRNLALLYEKRGFRQKAMDTWERALHARPEAKQKEEILERLRALRAREP